MAADAFHSPAFSIYSIKIDPAWMDHMRLLMC